MQALRFHGKKDIRLETIDRPICGAEQIAIRPAYVGICGTDLHEYLDGASLVPTSPHPVTGEQAPVTLGHEFSGVIEELGSNVTDFKVGQKVCIQPVIADETCGPCRDGLRNCCYAGGFVGLSGWGGGLSDRVVVPKGSVFRLPDGLGLDIGALVEPLAVAWHAVAISAFKPGDTVLVFGGGPIGLALVQVLKARKAKCILVSEVSIRRKEFAKSFGADYVLDPSEAPLVAQVKEICHGGVDMAFDAAGVQGSLDAALKATRAAGGIVNVALWGRSASIRPDELVFGERSYKGSLGYLDSDFVAVLKALETGAIQPANMITRKIQLDEVEEKGFKALIEDKDNQVKILVEVHPE